MEPLAENLTSCETQILQLHCDGFDCPRIAKIQETTTGTIEKHCENIRRKLDSKSMLRAVVIGLAYKLIVIRFVNE
ncbi:MAG: helix-turn-helix transcriptional regulator [Bacteroidetes bacterium]|nr:helix-turn-helix transcriptional regulator [Bacteroidota bacterium]